MATAPQPVQFIRFDVFVMDLIAGELRNNGFKVKLQEQPFAILTILAMRSGELVTREELYSTLPSHATYDAKHGLNNAIQKIREALGDSAKNPRFIETISNRGYKFLLRVEFIQKSSSKCDHIAYLSGEGLEREIKQIGEELLDTCSERELTVLLHRVNTLIAQQSQHPKVYEAQILRSRIEGAIDYLMYSEQNLVKHRISFETAAAVFDDPQALSVNGYGTSCYTLGKVWRQFGPFRRPILLMVSHDVIPGQNGHENVRITSARKATPAERRAYDQASKKRRQ